MNYQDLIRQWERFAILELEPDFIMVSPDEDIEGNAFQFPPHAVFFRRVAGYSGKPLLVAKQADAYKMVVLHRQIKDAASDI